jgi:cytochrome P450
MRYKDWVIPAGAAVGMSAYYIEFDESIFGKDPRTFRPERWLEPGAHVRMEPYLSAFGKGTRMCLGQNLAYAELYSVTATVLRRFPNLELYQTGPEDCEAVADYFAGMWRYENGKAGLQVMVKN